MPGVLSIDLQAEDKNHRSVGPRPGHLVNWGNQAQKFVIAVQWNLWTKTILDQLKSLQVSRCGSHSKSISEIIPTNQFQFCLNWMMGRRSRWFQGHKKLRLWPAQTSATPLLQLALAYITGTFPTVFSRPETLLATLGYLRPPAGTFGHPWACMWREIQHGHCCNHAKVIIHSHPNDLQPPTSASHLWADFRRQKRLKNTILVGISIEKIWMRWCQDHPVDLQSFMVSKQSVAKMPWSAVACKPQFLLF